MAYTTSVAGTAITASWANANVRDQGVSVFTDATARTAAVTVPVDGMISNLTTTDRVDVYNGSSWSALVAPSNGALTSWTPTVTQSGVVTFTNTYSRYLRAGRMIHGWFNLAITGGAGVAANAVVIGNLPFTSAISNQIVGSAEVNDQSAGNLKYPANVNLPSTTTMDMRNMTTAGAADNRVGVVSFTAALASGDTVIGTFAYEASADG